jgi:hypothetical protein
MGVSNAVEAVSYIDNRRLVEVRNPALQKALV